MKTFLAIALVVVFAGNHNAAIVPTLQGAWRAVEVTTTGPVPHTFVSGPNLSVFSASHYSRVLVQGLQTPLDDWRQATGDELRAAWGSFVGEAGTYEMSDRLITLRPLAAKNAAAVGKPIVFSYRRLDADTLLLTAISDRNGPVAHPETIKLQRVD